MREVARLHRRLAALVGRRRRRPAFARQVVSQAAPAGRDRARNLLWAAGKLAGYGIGLGLEPVPQVLLHPSVIERFTAHAPGLSGPARRTLRTNLRFLARAVVPHLVPGGRAAAPRARQGPVHAGARSAASWRWPMPSPRRRGGCAPPALVCLGAGAGLIRADLRAGARHRHLRPLRRRHRDRPRRPRAADGAGAGPLPRAAAGGSGVRRRRAAHRRHRPGTAQHQQPADPVAGRRHRAAARWTPPGCAPPGWPTPRS